MLFIKRFFCIYMFVGAFLIHKKYVFIRFVQETFLWSLTKKYLQ